MFDEMPRAPSIRASCEWVGQHKPQRNSVIRDVSPLQRASDAFPSRQTGERTHPSATIARFSGRQTLAPVARLGKERTHPRPQPE